MQLKTGVLTFHRCFNYGSYWQARCLVEAFRERGHNAVLLDHQSPRVERAERKCGFEPVLPTPVPREDHFLYGRKIAKFQRAFAALPRSSRFPLDQPEKLPRFDLVVVGSDEVWNLRHPWYARFPLFFGEGLPANRLVSYAGSFGNYHAAEGLDREWSERLRSFERLSVRDENSRVHLRCALGVEPELVLDPCLQFPVRPEGRWRGPRESFALVYGHNFPETFAGQARRWAAERGLPLVSIGYRNDWADRQWITAGPHDFAQAMERAAAVITNFFHGCVFALRNAKPFICGLTPYRSIKVENLLATVGGEEHLATEATGYPEYADRLNSPVDPSILRRMDALQRSSERFLEEIAGKEASLQARMEGAAA